MFYIFWNIFVYSHSKQPDSHVHMIVKCFSKDSTNSLLRFITFTDLFPNRENLFSNMREIKRIKPEGRLSREFNKFKGHFPGHTKWRNPAPCHDPPIRIWSY